MKLLKKMQSGFVRVASVAPKMRVADCKYNSEQTIGVFETAESEGIKVLVFPELGMTGYTCGELFLDPTLQQGAIEALLEVVKASVHFNGIAFVGLPLVIDDMLFNCAAAVQKGRILGVVPKSFIPGYKEFYEPRYFSPAVAARSKEVEIGGRLVPFGTDILFKDSDLPELVIGVEICEDLWVPLKPSTFQSVHGATVLVNLSASNELIGKADYRRGLVTHQSANCVAAYIYASCGVFESTTDVVFGGHCIIAENGSMITESPRFERAEVMVKADIDLDRMRFDRVRMNSFGDAQESLGIVRSYRQIAFRTVQPTAPVKLLRTVEAHPFVPRNSAKLKERCHEIFNIQVAGLAKRLNYVGSKHVTIGVSGGLDSTLALLVTCKTFDLLGWSRDRIHAYTMPGFGTTSRTKNNAHALMKQLGVTVKEVDIRFLCLEEMRKMDHQPFGIDLNQLVKEVFSKAQPPHGGPALLLETVQNTLADEFSKLLVDLPDNNRNDLIFENTQARMRTSILMNSGFQIGTGDLSELALGWCTYGADHMSGYNPNCSIPKTLVKFLVKWAAENQFDGKSKDTLMDIVGTEISPELLPTGKDGKMKQKTEEVIGPYELHDFFMYNLLRFGTSPEKILYLASQAKFNQQYTSEELFRWLKVFLKRFFNQQFKRSCQPDGPKVGSVSLSPRGDWRMPSDAESALWLNWTAHESELKSQLEKISNAVENTAEQDLVKMQSTVDMSQAALLLVDLLNDFGSKGNLPVQNGETIVPIVNQLQPLARLRVAIRDRHPQNHGSFASNHPGKKLFEKINLNGVPDQVLWPDHCVEGTSGAEFFANLDVSNLDHTVYKGTDPRVDSYSGFFANDKTTPTGLDNYLKAQNVQKVVVVGLATDYCVQFTALDARKLGYETYLVIDACRGLSKAGEDQAVEEMRKAGVRVVFSSTFQNSCWGNPATTGGAVLPPPTSTPIQ